VLRTLKVFKKNINKPHKRRKRQVEVKSVRVTGNAAYLYLGDEFVVAGPCNSEAALMSSKVVNRRE
jgi:hypothetical protein